MCGRCRRALAPASTAKVDFAEIYPPRARNRPPAWRLREAADRVAKSIPKPKITRPTLPPISWRSMVADTRKSLICSVGMIPGLGAFLFQRYRQASWQVAAAAALLLLTLLTSHWTISDWFALALAGLCVYSEFETLRLCYPPPADEDRKALRHLRYASGAVFMVTVSIIAATWMIGRLYYVNNRGLGPTVRQGDILLVRPQDGSAHIARGEVVAADLSSAGMSYDIAAADEGVQIEGLMVDRVLGMPGDTVAVVQGKLSVNGRLAPQSMLPLGSMANSPDATVTVPANSFCVSRASLSVSFDDGPMPALGPTASSPLMILPRSAVLGRVIAVVAPARDRRLIR